MFYLKIFAIVCVFISIAGYVYALVDSDTMPRIVRFIALVLIGGQVVTLFLLLK
jgi:hypothetical protein